MIRLWGGRPAPAYVATQIRAVSRVGFGLADPADNVRLHDASESKLAALQLYTGADGRSLIAGHYGGTRRPPSLVSVPRQLALRSEVFFMSQRHVVPNVRGQYS